MKLGNEYTSVEKQRPDNCYGIMTRKGERQMAKKGLIICTTKWKMNGKTNNHLVKRNKKLNGMEQQMQI